MPTLLQTVSTLAHAGHDHTLAPGGESHHLLWLGLVTVALVATLGSWAWRRAAVKRDPRDEN